MNKGILFVAILLFFGLFIVLFQGDGIKGLATQYLTKQGYVCEGNYCSQCTIDNVQCFCETETCICGDKTVDKKMCTLKLMWKNVPKDS